MKVIIVGGGITGLATAIALKKVGITAKVYERTPDLKAVGAGIWVSPNAMKVMDWLGLGDAVRQEGKILERVTIANRNLESLRKNNSQFLMDDLSSSIVAIHRAKLQDILYAALDSKEVVLGKNYTKHVLEAGQVRVRFEDGSEAIGDILLGADGIHSKVRAALFADSQTRYSGQTCWRGVAKIDLATEHKAACTEAWGKEIRFGFSAISDEHIYWFAVAKAAEGEKDKDSEATKKSLLKRFGEHFADPVTAIIAQTPAQNIIRNDLSDLKRLKSWSKGPVCLLGDAGHATTPNMGQGGAQGIEDAYYISNILAKIPEYEKAFAVFEKERRKKVDYIVNTSWSFGRLAHGRFSQPILKLLLKLTPESLMAKQLQRVYTIPESFEHLES